MRTQLFLKKPAVKAATPPTNPPINAVTRIMAKDDPPRGNISAIFPESRCSFFISIHQAINAQKINTPANPARKAFQLFMGISNKEINEAIAILHQGRYRPPANERRVISKTASINFIILINGY